MVQKMAGFRRRLEVKNCGIILTPFLNGSGVETCSLIVYDLFTFL